MLFGISLIVFVLVHHAGLLLIFLHRLVFFIVHVQEAPLPPCHLRLHPLLFPLLMCLRHATNAVVVLSNQLAHSIYGKHAFLAERGALLVEISGAGQPRMLLVEGGLAGSGGGKT